MTLLKIAARNLASLGPPFRISTSVGSRDDTGSTSPRVKETGRARSGQAWHGQ